MRVKAGKRIYGAWAGNPQGREENSANCIEEVHEQGRGGMFYQCNRKRGHGKDGLYCKQHALAKSNDPIATWYETTNYGFEIKPVAVYAISDQRIGLKIGGSVSMVKKQDQFSRYWPTRGEAMEYLQRRVEAMRKNLETAEREFRKLELGQQ